MASSTFRVIPNSVTFTISIPCIRLYVYYITVVYWHQLDAKNTNMITSYKTNNSAVGTTHFSSNCQADTVHATSTDLNDICWQIHTCWFRSIQYIGSKSQLASVTLSKRKNKARLTWTNITDS